MDADAIFAEWKSSLTTNQPKNTNSHTLRLPVSQYTYNNKSGACACIAVAFSHLALKQGRVVMLFEIFALGVQSFLEYAIVECIENGNRWWERVQLKYGHQMQRYLTPFEVLQQTTDSKSSMRFMEHNGVLGDVKLLNKDAAIVSLVAVLRECAQRARSRQAGTAAVFTYGSTSKALVFFGMRCKCKDAPLACYIFDSHPTSGATITIFPCPDDLTRHILCSVGLVDAAEEFHYADTQSSAQSTTEQPISHAGLQMKRQLTQHVSAAALAEKRSSAVAEAEHTHHKQFEVLEFWLDD